MVVNWPIHEILFYNSRHDQIGNSYQLVVSLIDPIIPKGGLKTVLGNSKMIIVELIEALGRVNI